MPDRETVSYKLTGYSCAFSLSLSLPPCLHLAIFTSASERKCGRRLLANCDFGRIFSLDLALVSDVASVVSVRR